MKHTHDDAQSANEDLFVVELDERLEFAAGLLLDPMQGGCNNGLSCHGSDSGCLNVNSCY